ncbi:MAG: TonB-dependent receptor domain-containing protein, partial [Bacteroidales bacterium]
TYLMADLNLTRYVNLVGGVRYENIRTDYKSWGIRSITFITSVLDTLPDNIAVRENDFFLPMINAKIMPFRWMDIRLAYTQSIARPRYTSFMPRYIIDRDGNLSSIGNPVLRPALSENMDIYLSIHGNKVGLFTIGAFTKRIDGFEYSKQFNKDNPLSVEKLEEILLYPEIPDDLGTLRSIGRININSSEYSYVRGVEVDLQTTFWYLPAPLNGLTFSTNYTYSESEQTETRELVTVIRDARGFPIDREYRDSSFITPLIGQPKHIFNASLGYDFKGFSARLSYRHTAESFIGFVKAQTQLPEDRRLRAAYNQWDLAITYNIPWIEGLNVFFNATRFTNKIEGEYVKLSEGFNVIGFTPISSVARNDPGIYPLRDRYYSNFLITGLKYQF